MTDYACNHICCPDPTDPFHRHDCPPEECDACSWGPQKARAALSGGEK